MLGAATVGVTTGAIAFIGLLGAKEASRALKKKFGEPTADDLRHEIDGSLIQLGDVVADLEEARDKIPNIITDIGTLRRAKTTAYSELGIYIGAAQARYIEIRDVMIPEKAQVAQNGSLLAQQELQQLRMAREILNKRLLSLQTFHGVSLSELSAMNDLTTALSLSDVNISGHLTISQGQWMGTLAQASTAARVSEISESVANADAFGDKVFEASMRLSGMARKMAEISFERGGVAPDKLVGYLTEQARALGKTLSEQECRNRDLEGTQAKIHAATRKLLDAGSKAVMSQAAAITDGHAKQSTLEVPLSRGPVAANLNNHRNLD